MESGGFQESNKTAISGLGHGAATVQICFCLRPLVAANEAFTLTHL